uniref:EOG090X04W0 n=1 Tax=Scapholeberis mucronata TaxID=202097 RepID=A0A4Y7NLT7_9CRUS|nr:EOG090X04W0 [Scapholeberis mucronata]SVE93574.1 EOG090X04W0 [Scapholeberis mucronata]
MGQTAIFSVLFLTTVVTAQYQVRTDEMFAIQLSPSSFNISESDSPDQYRYGASLHGLPDLPKWINLVYHPNLKIGFIYGTPPSNLELIKLDLCALNILTYETSTKEVTIDIFPKEDPAVKRIQMKIHNLNLEDLMDEHKHTKFLDVFRKVLWTESASDLHIVELYSALAVGGRRPARRQDGEGVILTIGSRAEFSEVLRELEREVSPLWSLRLCPRDFKKTSSERYFRSKGFLVDWCSFKLIPQNTSLLVLSTISPPLSIDSKTELVIEQPNQILPDNIFLDIWKAPAKWEIPRRYYNEEGVVAIFIPLVLLLILVALLTAILGVHPEGEEPEEGQLYEGMFEELPFLKSKQNQEATPRIDTEISTGVPSKYSRSRESTTPTASLGRVKRNPLYDSMVEQVARGSSPFLLSSGSTPSPTPVSTLSRSVITSPRSTLGPSERTSTIGRPEPPRYIGSLNK